MRDLKLGDYVVNAHDGSVPTTPHRVIQIAQPGSAREGMVKLAAMDTPWFFPESLRLVDTERNDYIVTPSHVHIAVDDPVSDDLSLRTACGRDLRDGLTQYTDPETGKWRKIKRADLTDRFRLFYSCRTCFTRTGQEPTPAGFAPRSWRQR